jgi:hypothetical protein
VKDCSENDLINRCISLDDVLKSRKVEESRKKENEMDDLLKKRRFRLKYKLENKALAVKEEAIGFLTIYNMG